MPLLETRGLSKRFPGIVALDEVDFEADAGEVRAVVGANGAGKSTFMNILAGVFPPSSGEIRLAGQPVAFASPRAAHELGINIVFQEFSSTFELTVAENIFLGREPEGWGFPKSSSSWRSTFSRSAGSPGYQYCR